MIYIFADDYELDLQRYELRYAGKLVKLEPQVFNFFVYLIQHRDRVVSKDELLEQDLPLLRSEINNVFSSRHVWTLLCL
jgi:DNA-binding winged helix-turn-helix (wHTH) protein